MKVRLSSFCSFKLKCGCGGYLDNFKILSILTLTFKCGFPCPLGLEKLRKMPRCNYILIKLPNFVFIVVWRFTLFCPLRGDVWPSIIENSFIVIRRIWIFVGNIALYWTWWPLSIYLTSVAMQNTSATHGHPHLPLSFTSLKKEFNSVIIRQMAASIQLSTVNNIFKATALKATQEIVKFYLEYRRKTYIRPCNF